MDTVSALSDTAAKPKRKWRYIYPQPTIIEAGESECRNALSFSGFFCFLGRKNDAGKIQAK